MSEEEIGPQFDGVPGRQAKGIAAALKSVPRCPLEGVTFRSVD